MSRGRAWSTMVSASLPLAALSSCFTDDVVRRVLADNIISVIVGAIDTVVATFFDRLFGVA